MLRINKKLDKNRQEKYQKSKIDFFDFYLGKLNSNYFEIRVEIRNQHIQKPMSVQKNIRLYCFFSEFDFIMKTF